MNYAPQQKISESDDGPAVADIYEAPPRSQGRCGVIADEFDRCNAARRVLQHRQYVGYCNIGSLSDGFVPATLALHPLPPTTAGGGGALDGTNLCYHEERCEPEG